MASCHVANNKPNYDGITLQTMGSRRCGLSDMLVSAVITKHARGPVDGAKDEDGNGAVDLDESFTTWDFSQTLRVISQGESEAPVTWTNVDTCYQFEVVPHAFYEDHSMKAVWQTCRDFTYTVHNHVGRWVGSNKGSACRNFATHEWMFR